MTPVDDRYRAIVADLEPSDVTALWYAALSGRPVDRALRDQLAQLNALRDDIGRASARRRDQFEHTKIAD